MRWSWPGALGGGPRVGVMRVAVCGVRGSAGGAATRPGDATRRRHSGQRRVTRRCTWGTTVLHSGVGASGEGGVAAAVLTTSGAAVGAARGARASGEGGGGACARAWHGCARAVSAVGKRGSVRRGAASACLRTRAHGPARRGGTLWPGEKPWAERAGGAATWSCGGRPSGGPGRRPGRA